MNSTTPQLRKEPSNICQFATQLAQVQAIAAHGGEVGVAFIGDSITQGWTWSGPSWGREWAPRRCLNLGIGGDQTGHLLLRLQNGLLDGIAPQAVVQLIGVNNCWNQPAVEEVVAGVDICLKEVRRAQPTTRVLCLGILPLNQGCTYARPLAQAVNAQLAAVAHRHGCDFSDVAPRFLNSDGSVADGLLTDGCHLSGEGYERLTAGVLEWLG